VGGVKKGQKYAYVIIEWSLTYYIEYISMTSVVHIFSKNKVVFLKTSFF